MISLADSWAKASGTHSAATTAIAAVLMTRMSPPFVCRDHPLQSCYVDIEDPARSNGSCKGLPAAESFADTTA